jgi:hypothetical protein
MSSTEPPTGRESTLPATIEVPRQLRTSLTALEALRRAIPTALIFIAVLALVLAITSAEKWYALSRDMHQLMEGALRARLESAATNYQGLAALLLSRLDDPATANAPPGSVGSAAATVGQVFADAQLAVASPPTPSGLIKSLGLGVQGSGAPWFRTLVSARSDVYLRAPLAGLSNASPKDLGHGISAEALAKLLLANRDLLCDLAASAKVAPRVARLSGTALAGYAIVQSYFLTQSGAIVLHAERAGQNQSGWYHGQLQPFRTFADRPYFWKCAEAAGRSDDPIMQTTRWHYESAPYVDLGGNGIVKTYAMGKLLSNGRIAVLAIDCNVANAQEVIARRIRPFGGTLVLTTMVETGLASQTPIPGFGWVEALARRDEEGRRSLMGEIVMDPAEADIGNYDDPGVMTELLRIVGMPPLDRAKSTQPDVIRFAIPLTSELTESGHRLTHLGLATLDLGAFRRTRERYLIFSIVGSLVFVFACATLMKDYWLLRGSLKKLIDNMTRVMAGADTPFAVFNHKNELMDCNNAFLSAVGYDNLEAMIARNGGRRPTFRSLLVAESQVVYDQVIRAGSLGGSTPEYEVVMIRANSSHVRVRVHGENVPYPVFWHWHSPHRFGVLRVIADN